MKTFIFLSFLSWYCLFLFENVVKNDQMDLVATAIFSGEKAQAFTILNEKCNVCHEAKKKVIFTLGNMKTNASDIHQQVFVKKRMPKGKKFPLTEAESLILKNWLATLSIP